MRNSRIFREFLEISRNICCCRTDFRWKFDREKSFVTAWVCTGTSVHRNGYLMFGLPQIEPWYRRSTRTNSSGDKTFYVIKFPIESVFRIYVPMIVMNWVSMWHPRVKNKNQFVPFSRARSRRHIEKLEKKFSQKNDESQNLKTEVSNLKQQLSESQCVLIL